MVTYSKPYRTFEEQAQLLVSRGIQLRSDRALWALERIGYYRLSGYWYPYRQVDTEGSDAAGKPVRRSNVVPGTDIEQILRLYEFDRQLKLLVMEAIERVEVALRVEIAYVLGKRHPTAHQRPECLDGRFTKPRPGRPSRHDDWLRKFDEHLDRSSEEFVEHFKRKYDGDLPVWVAIEVLDFGSMSILFHGCKPPDRSMIADRLGVVDATGVGDGKALGNWLRVLNLLRNTSAHHARLWNRNLVDQVATSRVGHIRELAHLSSLSARDLARVYPAITVLSWLLKSVDPTTDWVDRLRELLGRFPSDGVVALADMGVPAAWRELLN